MLETNVAFESLLSHPTKPFGVLEEWQTLFGQKFLPVADEIVGVSLGKRLYWQARVVSVAGVN